jgi:hypothetical protein
MTVRVHLPEQNLTQGFRDRDAALAWIKRVLERAPSTEYEILDNSDAT